MLYVYFMFRFNVVFYDEKKSIFFVLSRNQYIIKTYKQHYHSAKYGSVLSIVMSGRIRFSFVGSNWSNCATRS